MIIPIFQKVVTKLLFKKIIPAYMLWWDYLCQITGAALAEGKTLLKPLFPTA